jgi:hypothetical protein
MTMDGDHEKPGGQGTIDENVRPTLSLLRATFYILPPKSKDNFLIVEMAFSNLIPGGGRRQLYKLQDFLTKYPGNPPPPHAFLAENFCFIVNEIDIICLLLLFYKTTKNLLFYKSTKNCNIFEKVLLLHLMDTAVHVDLLFYRQ